MKMNLEKQGRKQYLIFQEEVSYQEDYQVAMMKHNEIGALLPMRMEEKDGEVAFAYDITGRISLKQYFENHSLNDLEMDRFVESLLNVTKEMKYFLLEKDRLILNPACIFVEDNQFQFCYLPLFRKNFTESFHKLTEYFVRNVDYECPGALQFGCRLHKYTLKEDYQLEQVFGTVKNEVKEFLHPKEEEPVPIEPVMAPVKPEPRKRGRIGIRNRRVSKWGEWENL